MQCCRSARDRLVVLLLGRVGLRRGQAAALRHSDVMCCRTRGHWAGLYVRPEAWPADLVTMRR
ncbi:hypothetical protein ACH4U5_38300 [Streptomyces sp. NPDC020858]|uniref:hypothetical protein n=1 Tax=Streptomyces sp. NPDC020858 TaxID=3365097 RepID=UPI0037AFB854